MTQAVAARSLQPAESRLIAAVCGAHLMSHYYMLMLAPLLAFVRDDFNVTYTQLALALTVFNVVAAVMQTPVGFLVDRIGARTVLIGGLFLSSIAYAVAGLINSYWVFIAMYGVAGLGNTAYHPSDYALLSRHAPPQRISQIFSIHTFAGMVGSAIAPVTLLYMQGQFGWRGAYIGSSILGLIALVALIAQPEPAAENASPGKAAAKPKAGAGNAGWRLLMSAPILLNFGYFTLTALLGNGLNTYLVVALGALHATPVTIANLALTALLAFNAIGVLVGGFLAGRSSHHALVAALGLGAGGILTGLIGIFDFASISLVALMALSGFCLGITYPSRDMLVRAVTPPGAFGRVFGFVTTGFSVGGSIAPLLYGMLMDHGEARWVFLLSAAISIACIATVTFGLSGRQAH